MDRVRSSWRAVFVFAFDELILVVILFAILLAFHVRLTEQQRMMEGMFASAISPDGSLVAMSSSWGTAVVDLETSEVLYHLEGPVVSVLFSPRGRRLLVAKEDGTFQLLDAPTGKGIRAWKDSRDWSTIRFHPDGRSVATGGLKGPIKIWSLGETPSSREIDPGIEVRRFEFAGAGDLLLLAGNDDGAGHLLQVWDLEKDVPLWTLGATAASRIGGMTVSDDGKKAVTVAGDMTTLHLWEIDKRSLVMLPDQASWGPVAFTSDGRILCHVGRDNTLTLMDLERGGKRTIPAKANIFSQVRFVDDDRTLVVANPVTTIGIWDVKTGKLRREFRARMQLPIAWGMTGGFVAWMAVWFWAYRRRRRHPERPTGAPERGVYLLAFVATAWVLSRFAVGALLSSEGSLLDATSAFPLLLAQVGLGAFFLAAPIFSLLALPLGFTRRFRIRLVFILPSLAISAWMAFLGI